MSTPTCVHCQKTRFEGSSLPACLCRCAWQRRAPCLEVVQDHRRYQEPEGDEVVSGEDGEVPAWAWKHAWLGSALESVEGATLCLPLHLCLASLKKRAGNA